MTSAERAATGLQTYDVTVDSVGAVFDHLPLVFDFRVFEFSSADFNFDRAVDADDLATWQFGFGLTTTCTRDDGDADEDADVEGADFLRFQREYTGSVSPQSMFVPEPPIAAFWPMFIVLVVARRR